MIENVEKINESNGIIEIKYRNEIYKTWKVEFIRPFLFKFLKEKVPDSLIAREISKIDYTVFDNQLNDIIPIELQKTPISCDKFSHHCFEDSIRRQLNDNIKNHGKCWFFFDSEYLRYLQSGNVNKSISVDLTWIIDLMKENTLKVFTIKYNGTVTELKSKDFDFLKELYTNNEIILNKNKLKIFHSVINGYKFSQEEITQFENEFDNRDDESKGSADYFIKNNNERCELYGNITKAIYELLNINDSLSCIVKDKFKRTAEGVTLGLFHQNNFRGNSNNAQIQFTDKFNIAQYFPGYIKNKEMWDYCKNKQRIFSSNDFYGIVTGTFNYEFIKKQSTILDY